MKPRGLTIVNGLVLGAIMVTTAWGQSSTTERKTLADRMSALRRGWGQNDAPATDEPQQAAGADRSIIPGWLGGDDQKPQATTRRPVHNPAQAQRNAGQQQGQQQNRFRQVPSTRTTPPRTAVTQRAGTTRPMSPEGFTLPGLGGTPLPAAERAKVPSGVARANTGDRYGISQGDSDNYPVIRDVTPRGATTPTAGTNAVKPSPSRQSPMRRSVPQVDPEALRRELAGPVPGATPAREPIARTARADDATSARNEITPETSDESAAADDASATTPTPEIAAEESTESSSRGSTSSESDEPQSAAEAFGAPAERKSPFGVGEFIRSPRTSSQMAEPSSDRSKEAFGEALQVAGGGDPTVLVSNQTPVIASDIRGPKQILVGREAVYRVRLQNQGTETAEGIVATIRIPTSAEVLETSPTQGTVQPGQNAAMSAQLEWHLPHLEGRGSEVLDIRLVPRESRPLEIGISWTVAPIGSRAIVEVQEPQLKIEIGGPNEVLFDKPQVFRLTLSNPGTGTAENVRIDLVPPGATQEAATSHAFGDLQPGDTKSVEIELTARDAGKLTMKAIASAEGGLISDSSKEIFCRKPELEVDWRGPATKYSGTPATYFFRVRNPGTAPADDVTVRVVLPEGAEFTSASEGQQFTPESREVSWRVGTLSPGDDSYMELKCIVKAAGANQFKVTAATSAGDLTDKEVAETNVVALADLKLAVSDPSGPVAVGSQAVYEIRVENRGSNAAKDVNVVALFSDGIEPDQAEGGTYTVADGRVSFRTIAELPAGRDVKLRIRARASKAGTHVFRAEVLCSDLEIKLAAEETTRFYADDVLPDSDEPQEQATSRYGFESAVR